VTPVLGYGWPLLAFLLSAIAAPGVAIANDLNSKLSAVPADTIGAWHEKISSEIKLRAQMHYPPDACGKRGTARVDFSLDRAAM
jgi:hypothetical protein